MKIYALERFSEYEPYVAELWEPIAFFTNRGAAYSARIFTIENDKYYNEHSLRVVEEQVYETAEEYTEKGEA